MTRRVLAPAYAWSVHETSCPPPPLSTLQHDNVRTVEPRLKIEAFPPGAPVVLHRAMSINSRYVSATIAAQMSVDTAATESQHRFRPQDAHSKMTAFNKEAEVVYRHRARMTITPPLRYMAIPSEDSQCLFPEHPSMLLPGRCFVDTHSGGLRGSLRAPLPCTNLTWQPRG